MVSKRGSLVNSTGTLAFNDAPQPPLLQKRGVFLISNVLILVCLSAFMSACAIPLSQSPPIPDCPMGDVSEYLLCAEPHFRWFHVEGETNAEQLRNVSDSIIAYCSDDPTEWLPVLDRVARKSVRKSRNIIKDKLEAADGEQRNEMGLRLLQKDHKILVQQYKSLKDRKLFSYGLGSLIISPAYSGGISGNANRESCATLFESPETSEVIEDLVPRKFFGRYDWYFGRQ